MFYLNLFWDLICRSTGYLKVRWTMIEFHAVVAGQIDAGHADQVLVLADHACFK